MLRTTQCGYLDTLTCSGVNSNQFALTNDFGTLRTPRL